jgi:hypothetical protein
VRTAGPAFAAVLASTRSPASSSPPSRWCPRSPQPALPGPPVRPCAPAASAPLPRPQLRPRRQAETRVHRLRSTGPRPGPCRRGPGAPRAVEASCSCSATLLLEAPGTRAHATTSPARLQMCPPPSGAGSLSACPTAVSAPASAPQTPHFRCAHGPSPSAGSRLPCARPAGMPLQNGRPRCVAARPDPHRRTWSRSRPWSRRTRTVRSTSALSSLCGPTPRLPPRRKRSPQGPSPARRDAGADGGHWRCSQLGTVEHGQ